MGMKWRFLVLHPSPMLWVLISRLAPQIPTIGRTVSALRNIKNINRGDCSLRCFAVSLAAAFSNKSIKESEGW